MSSTATPPVRAPREERGLRIGGRLLPTRAFLAPLAGYTQLPLRLALRELGGIGLATTDLVQARMLLAGNAQTLEIVATAPGDEPLSVQIYGRDEFEIADAARRLEESGAGGVDLNMGCPMGKIQGQGGATLARDVDAAARIVRAAVEAVRIPVTVKMRLGWDRRSITAGALAREFEALGAAAITIHGRTRQQGFGGSVDLAGIRSVVESVRGIPVVGNGDVRTVEEYLRMRRETGCHAVAIGRGAMLDPWIFRRIERVLTGGDPETGPTPGEGIDFLVRHFRLMVERQGERACLNFRKFAAWYGVRLGIPEDLEDRLRRLGSTGEFEDLVEAIRRRHGERRGGTPTALLRVPNGPVERW